MARKFYVIGCHVLWRELAYYAAQSPHTFNFEFLPQGLHNTPDVLRQELQKAIDAVPDEYDAILVGYGLCSNGISGITARSVPLVIPRGHDCITYLLGSKERYREYFDNHPGTYWYSPGWIESGTQPGKVRYEATLKHYAEIYGEDNAEYMMQAEQGWFEKYNNAAYVDLGVGDVKQHKEYTRECAEWLGWNCEIIQGDAKMAADFANGDWDEDRFLVVQPGETVLPSHDESTIIEARKKDG